MPSAPRQLRAQQGYLVKFPAELFEVLPNIGAARTQEEPLVPEEISEDNERQGRPVPRG